MLYSYVPTYPRVGRYAILRGTYHMRTHTYSKQTLPHTRRLDTRGVSSRSGKSNVFAMASTVRRAWGCVAQSKI